MVNIGDLVPKSGMYTEPGVVVEKKTDGTVTIDTEPMAIHKYHRYANTTGLTPKEKAKFNKILDTIYAQDDDMARLNDIQKEIDQLKASIINAQEREQKAYIDEIIQGADARGDRLQREERL